LHRRLASQRSDRFPTGANPDFVDHETGPVTRDPDPVETERPDAGIPANKRFGRLRSVRIRIVEQMGHLIPVMMIIDANRPEVSVEQAFAGPQRTACRRAAPAGETPAVGIGASLSEEKHLAALLRGVPVKAQSPE